MTTRETTLGALTAADLGKRVGVGDSIAWTLTEVQHFLDDDGTPQTHILLLGANYLPSTTPVTVYDEEADDD